MPPSAQGFAPKLGRSVSIQARKISPTMARTARASSAAAIAAPASAKAPPEPGLDLLDRADLHERQDGRCEHSTWPGRISRRCLPIPGPSIPPRSLPESGRHCLSDSGPAFRSAGRTTRGSPGAEPAYEEVLRGRSRSRQLVARDQGCHVSVAGRRKSRMAPRSSQRISSWWPGRPRRGRGAGSRRSRRSRRR